MAIPTWVVGQVLSASDVNDWLVPLESYKFIDESVTNSTTLHPDAALLVSVAANAMYSFRIHLGYEGGAQGLSDIKFNFSVPSGTTMRWQRYGVTTSGAAALPAWNTESSSATLGSNGAGVGMAGHIIGTIDTSSTTGTVQFQWAQNTLSATATKVYLGSAMVADRIG